MYETITQKITDQTTAIVVVATLKAKIDPNGIYDYLKRDDKEKVTIVQQSDSLQDAIARNDKEFEDLKEQYKRATTQAERDRIRKQLNDTDRDFLANEKLEEALKLYYAKDYDGAINLYNEALNFGEYAEIYNNRGVSYNDLGQHELAISDYDKALELNPNYADAYNNRGLAHALLGNFQQAIADATRAIKIDPNHVTAYQLRGICYQELGEEAKAQADFAKAKELGYNG